jgi:hypothetical protein
MNHNPNCALFEEWGDDELLCELLDRASSLTKAGEISEFVKLNPRLGLLIESYNADLKAASIVLEEIEKCFTNSHMATL